MEWARDATHLHEQLSTESERILGSAETKQNWDDDSQE